MGMDIKAKYGIDPGKLIEGAWGIVTEADEFFKHSEATVGDLWAKCFDIDSEGCCTMNARYANAGPAIEGPGGKYFVHIFKPII